MDWRKRDGNKWSDVATVCAEMFFLRITPCASLFALVCPISVKHGELQKNASTTHCLCVPSVRQTSPHLSTSHLGISLQKKSRQRCCEGRLATTAGDRGPYPCETQHNEQLACLSLFSTLWLARPPVSDVLLKLLHRSFLPVLTCCPLHSPA